MKLGENLEDKVFDAFNNLHIQLTKAKVQRLPMSDMRLVIFWQPIILRWN